MKGQVAPVPSKGESRRRVLLIDDDPTQFSCMRELFACFRGVRYQLDWAPTFGQGLVSLLSGQYAACLLDYQLGQSTGIELLQQVNAAGCRTPVIMVTGWSDGDIDLEAINAGATDYLVKGELSLRSLERSLRYAVRMGETIEALRQAATHDELTGLLNRRELNRLLSEELTRSMRFGRMFSFTLLDIDHFKDVNDSRGHPAGDRVLKSIATLLSEEVRTVDRVARYGGEEFAIIQIETGLEHALPLGQRILQRAEASYVILDPATPPLRVTLSAGVACFPSHGGSVEEIIAAADRALYQAKESGRNQVCVAGPATNPLTQG